MKTPLKKKKPLKAFTRFRIRIRSRHPSHNPLRKLLGLLPFRSIVRLGSTTIEPDNHRLIECNTVEAVKNSANKLRMKRCFTGHNVRTAAWWRIDGPAANPIIKAVADSNSDVIMHGPSISFGELPFPVVGKSLNGSRGRGNTLIKTLAEFEQWLQGKDQSNYIVEKFHDYSREYRLHVTKDGCFYTCRKMLKSTTPEKDRWFRNDSNSSWIVEENPAFDKPVNWADIVSECVKALNAVGLDVGACDVKVQSKNDKKNQPRQSPEFIVIEINSAPSFGEGTLQKYLGEIPRILRAKASGPKTI